MTDDIRGAETLAAALAGGRPGNSVAPLVRLADDVEHALASHRLGAADRERIYAKAARLAAPERQDVRIRRAVHTVRSVRVGRRGVIGGVAAGTLAAAIGYAVIQQRRKQGTSRVRAASALA